MLRDTGLERRLYSDDNVHMSSGAGAGSTLARFSTADISDTDRLAQWREVFGRSVARLDLSPLAPDRDYRCDISGYALPGVTVALGSYVNVRSERTRELAADGNDDTIFAIVTGGSGTLSRPGRALALHSGDGAISGNGIVGVTAEAPQALRLLNFAIPSRSLAASVRDIGDIAIIPAAARNEAVRLLRTYALHLLASDERPATPEVKHLVATHILDLVAVALGATRDAGELANRRGVRAARLYAIKEDAVRNLANPAITAEWLAQQHGLSASYIRKLFEAHGTTLSEFLLEARLAYAYRQLGDPRFGGRQVSAIAFEAGFSDLSYFNRTFRRRYGCTPSDTKAAARAAALRQTD